MYIRTRLGRRITEDRNQLKKEHIEDAGVFKQKLDLGNQLINDKFKIESLINEIERNDTLTNENKTTILSKLYLTLEVIEKEYYEKIDADLSKIKFSMEERLVEMENATKEREHQLYESERLIYNIKKVNKEKIVDSYRALYKEYNQQFLSTKDEIESLCQLSLEQKNKMIK